MKVRASSTPKPFWPVSVSVKVQPDPGVPSTDVGTVMVTSPGVSPPEGDSCATETCGVPTVDEPEIAYELFRRAHGLGYATEAARAVLDAAIATGRERLWSTVRTWNTPSFRVLDKLGFERDHVSTDDRGEIVWLTRTLP